MRHKRVVIALTCSIFAVVCLLSMYRLFSVGECKVNYSVYDENIDEAESLLEKYSGKLIFFVDVNEIEREINKNRYLKVVSVKKEYPCTIVVDLAERVERYAVQFGDLWYFLDDEFFAVRSDSEKASLRGEKLTALTFYDINGNAVEQSCSLKQTFEFPEDTDENVRKMLSGLGELSEKVTEIRFVFTSEKGNYRVRFYMAEGVVIEVQKAAENSLEKLSAGLDCYTKLPAERKMRGFVIVNKNDEGIIQAVHSQSH